MPNGIGGVGFGKADLGALRASALPQKRLLANAPLPIGAPELESLFEGAIDYW
jgi:hydroxyacid-oxoacid transhydrogenase